jgi:hypothetical protein
VAAVHNMAGGKWLIQKAVVITICTIAGTGHCYAEAIQLRSLIQIDCSAYQRQDDGTWIVLRQNTVTRSGKVAREVIPEDNPDTSKLTDGTSLRRTLDGFCARSKN